jgi:hypothetical protein
MIEARVDDAAVVRGRVLTGFAMAFEDADLATAHGDRPRRRETDHAGANDDDHDADSIGMQILAS